MKNDRKYKAKPSLIFGRSRLENNFEIAVVPPGRLELPRPCRQQILSLPRLPFRHRGAYRMSQHQDFGRIPQDRPHYIAPVTEVNA